MASPTNLTDRISHLRERPSRATAGQGPAHRPTPPAAKRKVTLERKPASDYFMIFVYALLAIAFVSQLMLIVFLDVV